MSRQYEHVYTTHVLTIKSEGEVNDNNGNVEVD